VILTPMVKASDCGGRKAGALTQDADSAAEV
jgi:hypothetical protein